MCLVFSQLSCSNHNPLNPETRKTTPESPLRNILWYNTNIGIAQTIDDERSADVTNVVLDRHWLDKHNSEDPEDWTNGDVGYVLTNGNFPHKTTPPYPYPAELNVIAWTTGQNEVIGQEGHTYYEVNFKAYGISTSVLIGVIDGDTFTIPADTWQYGNDTVHYSYTRPKVTAFMDGSNPTDPRLVAAITFQRNKVWGTEREYEVWWAIYKQSTSGSYDDWDEVIEPTMVGPQDEEWAVHPDIVYGAYLGVWNEAHEEQNPDFEGIVIMYEEIDTSSGHSSLYTADLCEDNGWEGDWVYEDVLDSEQAVGFWKIPVYPRIDIGLDSSWSEGSSYYVLGAVWTEVWLSEEELRFNIRYGGRSYNIYDTTWVEQGYIDYLDTDQEKNGLPYVDIDPLENYWEGQNDNYSHVVFSKYIDENGNQCEPYYINSYTLIRLQDGDGITQIYNSQYGERAGLPTIAAYTDQSSDVGSIQFMDEDDEDDYQYPIYSTACSYHTGPEDPEFSGPERVTYVDPITEEYEYTTEDDDWAFGPSNAVRGENTIICVWTEMSYLTAPDIFADIDD